MEKQRNRLTASERESLIRMNIALEILTQEPAGLARRSALVPGAKRDLAMMATKIRKLMEGFTKTIPDDQLLIYRRALQMSSYTVGMKKPVFNQRNEKDFGMWLPFEVINELLAGLHEKCMMCDLDTVGRKKCPLRKALTIIPNDVPDRDDGDCPYYTVI